MGGSQLDPALGDPYRSLLSKIFWGLRTRPPVGLNFWTFFNQTSLRSTWLFRLSQWVQNTFARSSSCIHPLQEILRADSVLGGDTEHPANHSSIVTLQAMQVGYGWGPGFACMEHGTPDTWIVNSSSGSDGKWAGVEDRQEFIEFAPCDVATCDSSEFTTATWG